MDTVVDHDGSDIPEVDSTPLGIDALFDVKKALNTVSAKWYDIGIALRLNPNTLDGIQTSKGGDPSTCLSLMLTEWLKKNYNEKFGEPTWKWLVDAVGDTAGGGHTALARDIAGKHKPRPISGVRPKSDMVSVEPEQTHSGKLHRKKAQQVAAKPAVSAAGYVMDKSGQILGKWQKLCGSGRRSLTLGTPSSQDVVLYEEQIRKEYEFFSKVSHTFSYNCRRGEEITAVLAYDLWDDSTGGDPKRESGGVGQDAVSICVTSQFNRGFHFKFIVYGRC